MSPLSLVAPYFAENRCRIAIGLLSLIVVDVLQLIIPRVIKWAVDDLAGQQADPGRLLHYGGAICLIAVLVGAFRYVWRIFLLGTSRRVEQGLRDHLFAHLQTLSAGYFDRTRTGDLMAHATNDIQQIRMAAGMGLVALNDALVMGAATIAFMMLIDLRLTALALIPMPLIAVGARTFSRRMHRRYQAVQASVGEVTEVGPPPPPGLSLRALPNPSRPGTTTCSASSENTTRSGLTSSNLNVPAMCAPRP
jgi:ATP-binding cassette subfamily B protein